MKLFVHKFLNNLCKYVHLQFFNSFFLSSWPTQRKAAVRSDHTISSRFSPGRSGHDDESSSDIRQVVQTLWWLVIITLENWEITLFCGNDSELWETATLQFPGFMSREIDMISLHNCSSHKHCVLGRILAINWQAISYICGWEMSQWWVTIPSLTVIWDQLINIISTNISQWSYYKMAKFKSAESH